MKHIITILAILLSFAVSANADLNLIGQGTSVHGTYNLIYDTDIDITWYDFTRTTESWQNQMDWADALSVTFESNTYTNWRLPIVVDGPYSWGYDGTTTAGYNITTSEMGHLLYTELGNTGYYDTNGDPTGCSDTSPYCPINTGDFQNLLSKYYFSGTLYSADTDLVWGSYNYFFKQDVRYYKDNFYSNAIAVHPGLVGTPVVSEPIIYDSNSDWTIDDFELLDGIDKWAAGNLGDFELLDLIDYWAAGCYQWDAISNSHKVGC